MGHFGPFSPFWPKRVLLVLLWVCIISITHGNLGFTVILMGEPIFYLKRFGSYVFGHFGPFLPFLAQKWYFWWFDQYILYQTLIETWGRRSFWVFKEPPIASGSRDIELGLFLTGFTLFSPKWTLPVDRNVNILWNYNKNLGLMIEGSTNFQRAVVRQIFNWAFSPLFALFGPKRALPVVWKVYIIWNTNKMHLAGPMMGQPTPYD